MLTCMNAIKNDRESQSLYTSFHLNAYLLLRACCETALGLKHWVIISHYNGLLYFIINVSKYFTTRVQCFTLFILGLKMMTLQINK